MEAKTNTPTSTFFCYCFDERTVPHLHSTRVSAPLHLLASITSLFLVDSVENPLFFHLSRRCHVRELLGVHDQAQL